MPSICSIARKERIGPLRSLASSLADSLESRFVRSVSGRRRIGKLDSSSRP
jgi:hypothetical protein